MVSGNCVALAPQPAKVPDAGYLTPATQPDATRYLPPPPQAGSARQAADDHAFQSTRGLKGGARWALATSDADLSMESLLRSYSCAAGFTLDARKAPRLVALISRMDSSEGPAMRYAKSTWHRPRPFVGNNQPICTESDRAHLATSGAYPSGHTILGWSTALVLAELLPDRSTEILQRGRVFGESRIVCGVHWASDVLEGYMSASADIAAMHGNPAFRADLDAARTELAGLRQASSAPNAQACAIEQDAATHSPL
ncbi:acid phosphatase [Novacetimonas maltaceti]|nr:acid phosphatase [Novacetimonas maltaceti]